MKTLKYRSFFSHTTDKDNPGYQINLIFDRDDNLYTICEIKYFQKKVGTNVIAECEKDALFFRANQTKLFTKFLFVIKEPMMHSYREVTLMTSQPETSSLTQKIGSPTHRSTH